MKNIMYIITGCLILGLGTITAYNTITDSNKIEENNNLIKVQTILDNAKNAYFDCLQYTSCNDCNKQYEDVKRAYDAFNKIK